MTPFGPKNQRFLGGSPPQRHHMTPYDTIWPQKSKIPGGPPPHLAPQTHEIPHLPARKYSTPNGYVCVVCTGPSWAIACVVLFLSFNRLLNSDVDAAASAELGIAPLGCLRLCGLAVAERRGQTVLVLELGFSRAAAARGRERKHSVRESWLACYSDKRVVCVYVCRKLAVFRNFRPNKWVGGRTRFRTTRAASTWVKVERGQLCKWNGASYR